MSTILRKYLTWAKKRDIEEHVTLPNFVYAFDLSNKEETTETFKQLIASHEIRENRRQRLKEAKVLVQRALEINSEIQSKRAGLTAQEAAVAQSDIGFSQVLSTVLCHPVGDKHDGREGVTEATTSALGSSSAPPPSTPTVLKRGRISRNLAASKVARRGTSKTRIKEPWHSLIETALLLHDGWQVDLPELDTCVEQEGTRRFKLYQLALHHLHNAKVCQVQAHFDRARCLDYKDAFVAFSGIWNTFSPTANELFGQSPTEEAKLLCYMQSIDKKDDILVKIMDGLLQKQTLYEILEETYHLQ
ncbi:hypothetical protein BGZ94_005537, partial [Podila epigama]